jgi:uncharacterized protein
MGRQQPWQVLAGLPAWQVTEMPRRPHQRDGEHPDARDLGRAQRFQALASAYCEAAPVAFAWVREHVGSPVRVLVAGPGLAAGSDGRQAVLALPSGARGQPLPVGEAEAALARVPCWVSLAGVSDVLLASGSEGMTTLDAAPSLEEGLLSAWLGPFAWLLVAEPADAGTVGELALEASRDQLSAQQNSSPRTQLAARRAAARHAELREAASTGLWRVQLLAGGTTPADARRVAGLLRASADLRGLPYALVSSASAVPAAAGARGNGQPGTSGMRSARQAMASPQWQVDALTSPAVAAQRLADASQDTPQPESPFYASTHLVAALARPPVREVPGLRFTLRPEFDVTPETAEVPGRQAVMVGTVLDWNRIPAGPLLISRESLNRHVFVCGATGAGKSQTVRNLLEQATTAGIPWLVVEPAKAEYRLMAARLPDAEVVRIRPGDLDLPAAGLNPLEPAPGPASARFPLQTHADLLRALFLAAFQADEPFPQVLSAALTRCYEQAGWDLVTGQSATPGVQPGYPALEDLQSAAIAVVEEIGYGREVTDNVRGFVTVRIGSLRLGIAGRFLDGGHPLDFAALLDSNVVLEIEDVGDDHDKAFIMGAVLIRLSEYLRLRQRSGDPAPVRLRHLTVIEEAHRLLRQSPVGTVAGPAAHATEMFADLLAEIRAYGEGLVIAEQIPAKIIPDVIKNTAVKIVHRLPAADDRQAVGATMNLTQDQSAYLVTLQSGEAAVHCDGMDYPVLARMPDGTVRETAQAVTASPEPVIGRRSLTCGTDCSGTACTLGQMREAQRAAVTEPRLTMWAELVVVAHLTGWEMPRPAPAFAASLETMSAGLRDCALAHAIDTAVAARAPVISSRISPGDLAAHVADIMREVVAGQEPGCAEREPQYLAPPFRWTLMRDALKEAASSGDPDNTLLEDACGEAIPGATIAEQLRVVNRWHFRSQRDKGEVSAVIWGTRRHTAIEQSVGAHAGSTEWRVQLAEMLTAFATMLWPQKVLSHPNARTPAAGVEAQRQ